MAAADVMEARLLDTIALEQIVEGLPGGTAECFKCHRLANLEVHHLEARPEIHPLLSSLYLQVPVATGTEVSPFIIEVDCL